MIIPTVSSGAQNTTAAIIPALGIAHLLAERTPRVQKPGREEQLPA
jgi:hypothetical protein